jgi:hypothetical protein
MANKENTYIDEVIKELSDKYFIKRGNTFGHKYVKSIIKVALEKQQAELIRKMRNGEICTSCGKKMEAGLSQWCEECLENN